MASMLVSKPSNTMSSSEEHKRIPIQHFEVPHSLGTAQEEADSLHDFPAIEQSRIYRKVDWRLTPMLMLLYFFANLDRFVLTSPELPLWFLMANSTNNSPWRANIGNAKIQGLEASLQMNGSDYNVASMIFFVSYILCEIPSNAILLRFKRPSIYLGILVFCWGTVMSCSGVVGTFGGLVATRFLLGVFEAGFFPGAVFLISQWYPPHLTQVRVAIFYGAAAISGAFSGLLAAAIAKMDGIGNYEAWRWIFIIEGLMTVVLGLCCFFILPDSPSLSGRWLTEHEIRFLNQMHQKHRGTRKQTAAEPGKMQKPQWPVLVSVLTDWQIYLQSLVFMSSAVPNYALKFTMPQIIVNMGFTSTQAQLLTAPPYICGAFSAVASAVLADRLTWRLPFIVGPQVLLVAAYSALFRLSGDVRGNVAACYFCVHLSTVGTYPIVPGANAWTLNNLAGPAKRALGVAFSIAMGSVGGIVGSLIFQEREKPRYPSGWGTCLAFVLSGMAAALALEATYFSINKRRARQGEEEIREKYSEDELESMGDRSPLFRYSL